MKKKTKRALFRKNDEVATIISYNVRSRPLPPGRCLMGTISASVEVMEKTGVEDIKQFLAKHESVTVDDICLEGVWGEREARESLKH